MDQNYQKVLKKKKWSPKLGEAQRNFLGHFGRVVARFQPFWPIRLDALEGAQDTLKWPKITQNGSGDPRMAIG